MLRISRRCLIIIIASSSFLISCKEEEPKASECDCTSNITSVVADIPALVVETSTGKFLLSIEHGFLSLCNDGDGSSFGDGQMISTSGKFKASCELVTNSNGIMQTFYDADELLLADDSIFRNSGIEIRIIKSEDYGYAPGFGYYIRDQKSNFKILQPIIPAVQGNHPFTSAQSAFKVAVFVAYKIKNNLHPAVGTFDLSWLEEQ